MTKDYIFELIVQHTCNVIPELEAHQFQYQDSLRELGANSVDRAEIITMTSESLSLKIPFVELTGAKNLGDLVDHFYAKL